MSSLPRLERDYLEASGYEVVLTFADARAGLPGVQEGL